MRDALELGRWQWQVGWVLVVSAVLARRLAHGGREWALVSERGLAQVLPEPEAQEVAVMAAAEVVVLGAVLRAVELGLAVVALQVLGRERALVQALESALGWVPGRAPELVSGLVREPATEWALVLELALEQA